MNEPYLIMSGTQYLVSSCNRVRNGWMFVVTDLILAGGYVGRAWWGCAWQWGMHGRVGGMRGGGMNGRGLCVAGACMVVGGVHGRGRAWQGDVRGRYYEIRSMSGRYASYWNALLYKTIFRFV